MAITDSFEVKRGEIYDVDWGEDFLIDVEYIAKIIPTLDGFTPLDGQTLTMTLIKEIGRVRYYGPNNVLSNS